MSDEPIRDWLEERLKDLLPSDWVIRKNQVQTGTLSKVTVTFKLMRIRKSPAAPAGELENEIIITIAHPSTDIVQAEDALDDQVIELLTAIDLTEGIYWTLAEKVQVGDTYLGWDITAQIYSQKQRKL